MKIMQIMPEFDLAGAEIMAENLTYSLIGRGHEVVVVSMYTKNTPITDRLEARGVKLIYLDKKSGFDLSIIGKLRKVFKLESPDIIHTHRYLARYAVPAAVMAGVKGRVHTVHNIASKELGSRDRKLNSFFYDHLGMYPVAISPEIKKTVIEEYSLPSEQVGMVYNGIDLANCTPKSDYNFGDEIKLLHVGRFNKQKNHVGIIRAFLKVRDMVPNAHLYFYGTGELEDQCKELTQELSLSGNVHFCGTTDDIYSVMNKSDIFLLCSNYEGMPITLIESMATALPIVATGVGGVVDMIVDGENGLICKVDEDDIAQKLLSMISDDTLRRKCAENAKQNSVRFSSEYMTDGYLEIYEKVLSKRK